MRRLTMSFLLCTGIFGMTAYGETVNFTGAKLPVQKVVPDKSTGLDAVYVAYDMEGLSISYESKGSEEVTWLRYSNLGGGYAEPVAMEKQGSTYFLTAPQGDMGYMIEQGGARYSFWLTDYSRHRLNLKGAWLPTHQDCQMTLIELEGSGEPIHYYSINGRQLTLDQEIQVNYNQLEFDQEARQWVQVQKTKSLESFQKSVYITPAVLCDTHFKVEGDKFLKAWNWAETAESGNFQTPAVAVHAFAEQSPLSEDPEYKSNQIGGNASSGELGGSAPCDISFTAYGSDAVIHHEWQFSKDPEFSNLLYRFNERDLDYTFREEGITYVRYIGSNASGTCEAESDVFTVSIGASDLKCPNAFSPGASEGVNDEWKVSYRSIIDFECWIFNRHGRQVFHFTDPEQGWDGKIGGKTVGTGVYFYVIDAKGADGKHYKLSGDINVLTHKPRMGNSSSTEE